MGMRAATIGSVDTPGCYIGKEICFIFFYFPFFLFLFSGGEFTSRDVPRKHRESYVYAIFVVFVDLAFGDF